MQKRACFKRSLVDMPILDRTLPSSREAVGFELPIFRSYKGANSDLVQRIAPDDSIECFQLTRLDTQHAIGVGDLELYVDDGDQALWAFRDEEQRLIVGARSDLTKYGIEALTNGYLGDYPVAAAEMAAFCQAQTRFPKVLKRAFEHLAAISQNSAASWLDVTVLLPAIKQDIAEYLGRTTADRRHLAQLIAVSGNEQITIYGPKQLVSREVPLPRFRPLAEIFDINSVRFISFDQSRVSPRQLVWRLAGSGGLTRAVLKGRPFFGRTHFNRATGLTETTAFGDSKLDLFAKPQLLVRVLGSDRVDVEYAKQQLAAADEFSYRHAINVRPMGYGTPRTSKVSTRDVSKQLIDADMVWLIATHKLRQTGTPMNGMGGLHTASRTLAGALKALVAHIDLNGEISFFLEALKNKNALGIIGTWRYNNNANIDDNLKRLIFNMLCEDALLNSAERISVMWSLKKIPVPDLQTVTFGRRQYKVEFIAPRNSSLGSTLVGFAVDIEPSRNSPTDFRDFCVDLFAGYGWWQAANSGSSVLMQRRDMTLRIFPTTAAEDLPGLLSERRSDKEKFLILTNKTVPSYLRQRIMTPSVNVIHYSELGRWLGAAFGEKLIAGL